MSRRSFLERVFSSLPGLVATSAYATTTSQFTPVAANSGDHSQTPPHQKNNDSISITQFQGSADYNPITKKGTNNTEAINNAIAYLKSRGGGELVLTRGLYLFDSIDIDADNISIVGNGSTLVSTLDKTTNKIAFWLSGNSVEVKDLNFDFREAVDAISSADIARRPKDAHCVRVGGRKNSGWSKDIKLENLSIKNSRNGGIDVYYGEFVSVTHCTVRNTLGNGIGFAACRQRILAAFNTVEQTGDDCIVVVADRTLPEGTASAIITGNQVRNGYAKGIATTGVDRAIISENSIENTWAQGIGIINDTYYGLGQSHNVICNSNIVKNAGKNFGPNRFKFENSNAPYSIHVSGGTSTIKVFGNLLLEGYSHGIVCSQSPALDVAGNTIKDHSGIAIVAGDPRSKKMDRINGARIADNTCIGNTGGISFGGGAGVRVLNNMIDLTSVQQTQEPIIELQFGSIDSALVSGNIVLSADTLNKQQSTDKLVATSEKSMRTAQKNNFIFPKNSFSMREF